MRIDKIYLGDGLYAEFDGWQIKITANDGVKDYNTIYLEGAVAVALKNFIDKCWEDRQ